MALFVVFQYPDITILQAPKGGATREAVIVGKIASSHSMCILKRKLKDRLLVTHIESLQCPPPGPLSTFNANIITLLRNEACKTLFRLKTSNDVHLSRFCQTYFPNINIWMIPIQYVPI